jgi:D-alanyl-D-alanine carboxypeptidase/D-alanyl-D-alanine-endopeptidase (penicillin-binding protein 4)
MIFSRSLYVTILSLALLALTATSARSDGAGLPADATAAIHAQLKKAEGRRGTAACRVVDLDTGETLFDAKGSQPLSPASNMKLLTTAAALKLLGGKFKFRTQLLADAEVSGGTLKGPLYVFGGGDPNISGRFYEGDNLALFRQWAAKLKQAGITRIDGGLRYDSTLFGSDGYCEGWPNDDQYIKWYCAEVSALAFNDNCVGVRVLPTQPGKPAKIKLSPSTKYVTIVNETTTARGRKGAEIGIVRPRGENTITVKGTIYEQATWGYFIDVTVHDPARYAATVLRETLEAEGITVGGDTAPCVLTAKEIEHCRVLHEHNMGLLDALGPINTNSQNLHAELLLRQLGLRYAGKGTFATSRAAMKDFLQGRGWWHEGLRVVDGSGLARDNRVTAELLTNVLAEMARDKSFNAFRDSLAVAGESGTLEKRLRDKELRGTIHAKTGYINGVRALSGYLINDKRRLAFSILMNDCVYSRQTQDEILAILAKEAG